MNPGTESAINRALFLQQALAHCRMMNPTRNAKGMMTAIMYQNATAAMAVPYGNIIIMAASTVGKGLVNGKKNEFWDRLKIYAVPLVW